MYRLIPLCLFLLVLPPVAAVQVTKQPEAPAEMKAIPTLAPGHHVGPINAMVFTPDGKRLITGGEDKTIQVWDVETGKRLRLFRPPVGPGKAGAINDLALAPDGKTLAVAGDNPSDGAKRVTNTAYLLNLDDGRILPLEVPNNGAVRSIAIAKDGRQIAITFGLKLRVYGDLKDAWDGKAPVLKPAIQLPGKGWVNAPIAFSPDGGHLLVLSRDTSPQLGQPLMGVVDMTTGKATPAAFDAKAPVSGAWSPDGKSIVTSHRTSKAAVLQVWSREGGEPLKTFTGKEILPMAATQLYIHQVVHHSGSKYLLACRSDGAVKGVLFDVETGVGKVVASVDADRDFGQPAVALSPDGKFGALTAAPQGQRIGLFELDGPGVRYLSGPGETIRQAGWTATGNSITWARWASQTKADSVTSGLNLRTLERLDRVSEPLVHETTSRDGFTLKKIPGGSYSLTRGDGKLKITGEVVTLPAAGPVEWVARGDIRGLALLSPQTGEVRRTFEPVWEAVRSVASSPDGKYLFATTLLGVGRVYRPDDSKPLLSFYTENLDWVAWTEEGYYAASPNGERLIGWTVNNKDLNKEANLITAEQFRATLYRPDVIKLLLDKGSVAEALKAANAARKMNKIEIPRGVADPGKLLPPNVSLTIDSKSLPKAVITVTAEQGCVDQPIKSLRLLIDGRPLPEGKARANYEGAEKEKVTETWTVDLPAGKHRLTILARSKDDTPSVSSAVLVESQVPVKERPVIHHVAVGISTYEKKELKLNVAHTDATNLAAALKASCDGKDTVYGEVRTTLLTNEKARRQAVLDALDGFRKTAKSNDLLVFSFAGHGVREDGEFYLLTHEADPTDGKTLTTTAISGADLRAKLADYPCQVLLMLDACHSAAFAPLAKYRPATDEAARSLADVEMRVAVMCAAQGHEEAFEDKVTGGHFTRAVIRALRHDKDAFYDRATNEVNVYHLQAFVYQEVSKATEFKQNPYLKMPLAHPPVIVTKFPKP